MKMNATEFKAKCLAVIDRVHTRRESVTIDKPWLRLRETPARWHGDPFAPVLTADEIEVLR